MILICNFDYVDARFFKDSFKDGFLLKCLNSCLTSIHTIKDLQATKYIISKAYGTFPHVHGSKLN